MSTVSGYVIQCGGLTKRFGSLTALDRLDLEIPAGMVFGYLGPNGAGKTTTLRMVMGLSKPSEGKVRVLGADPWAPRQRAVRDRIGYLPGELRMDDRLTAMGQLTHWARMRETPVDPAYRDALIERLGLNPTRPVRTLSTGNRRKVGLVGAFMSRPELLVLDEPTSGLDPLVQREFIRMVQEVREDGRTVLLSSHILSEVERLAERVAVLRAGELVMEGSVDELRGTARQRLEATFKDTPPTAELAELAGVLDVEAEGSTLRCTVQEPIAPVLEILARHGALTLVAPQPEIEDVFLRLYGSEPDAAQDGKANTAGNGEVAS
ncbi:ABC transporter ATP-binding protein [Streptomyces gobiensis]|uniref:ABC transporter ATP-binding protein n=1 Tax=Streptomyces gobiensis TaxID=2875706 RepID=UPI001E34CD03|nr:ABC transporter ATP-binding protein [Streptomyces gobiensis]UGY94153.1 ABC transporter ATP-binding protein [Streptomyces gobiensis]